MLAAFGYVFSNISVQRNIGNGQTKTIKVPCAFGSPHRDHTAYADDPNLKQKEGVRVKRTLPRMGYTLESWMFDPDRKKNTAERLSHSTEGWNKFQFQKVPYDLNITLGILVDQLDDLYQIIEQIVPWFDPKLVVSMKINDDLQTNDDVSIMLNSSDPNINFEGSFEDVKVIEASLNFTVKSYMYRRTNVGKPILTVDVDVLNIMDPLAVPDEYNSVSISFDESTP